MPGFFRCSGQTGQAPTTTYFGVVPDKLTMLLPAHIIASGHGVVLDSSFSPFLVSGWTRYNTSFDGGANQDSVSLGAFTIAPDQTTNAAQKIVESNANSIHMLSAGYINSPEQFVAGQTPFKLRLGVFAKAAERTRCVLQIGGQDIAAVSCKTVFDLANGAIAVANTATNGNTSTGIWTAGPASITSFGGGWYCCLMDCACLGNGFGGNGAILARFYLDAGSGSAAENSTYAGNGTSGLYVWKSSMLPPGAWALNTQVFFDDFLDNSMGNIDLTNSLQPGFNWYLKQTWPSFGAQLDTPASSLSCSGSVLTISQQPSSASGTSLTTLAPLGPGSWVGNNYFRPPALFESRWGWDESIVTSVGTAYWTTNVERLVTPQAQIDNVTVPKVVCEMDWVEQAPGGSPPWPQNTLFYQTAGRVGSLNTFAGYPLWSSTRFYSNQVVYYSGTLWQSQHGGNIGITPGTDITAWLPFSNAGNNIAAPDIPQIDFSQLHTWGVLWLPSLPDELGQVLNFFEGNFVGQSCPFMQAGSGQIVYGPNSDPRNAQATAFQIGDGQTYPIIYSAAFVGPIKIDWSRVTA